MSRDLALTLLATCLMGATARAQENALQADFRGESERAKQDCSGFSFAVVASCADLLFTDHPLHIAVGSIAPEDGFGFGGAFVTHWTPNERWRLSWDADAVVSTNTSWRAGVYMKAIYVPPLKVSVTTSGKRPANPNLVREYPVFGAYFQTISLEKLAFFGEGPDTSDTAETFYGMREIVVGGNAIWPVYQPLHIALFGEVNGRFVDIRPSAGQGRPTIGDVYTDSTAPGLANQPGFAQFGEGVRLRPTFLSDHVQLNYTMTVQEFAAASTGYSFERFTGDFSHEFPLYRNTPSYLPKDSNGPDDCSQGADQHTCPPVRKGLTRNREGSIGLRLLVSEAVVPSGNVVPFYFQPTLGGADVNGDSSLASYADYRFRGPDAVLARASIEHSLYGPVGATFMYDEGKVALTNSSLNFAHLAHSFSVGLTLRAGGLPFVYLLFAWGGHEGTHTIAEMDPSLLGGSARPSLF